MDLITVALSVGVVMLLVYLFVMRCTSWPILHLFKDLGLETPPASKLYGHWWEGIKYGAWDVQTVYHSMFRGVKAYGWYDFRTPVVVVRDLDMIKDIMVKHFSSFADRRVFIEFDPPFSDNLLNLHGARWKRVRNAVSPTFSSGRVKRMSSHVQRKVDLLLRILDQTQESNKELELKDIMSRFTMDTIASTGFGLEIDTLNNPNNDFNEEGKKFLNPNILLMLVTLMVPQFGKLLSKLGMSVFSHKAMDFFVKVIDTAFEMRKESGNSGKMNDFLDLVINAEKEEEENDGSERGLSRSEIYGQAIVFILAGYDTVSSVLAFTLFLLANHPEYQRRVQEELDQTMEEDSVPSYETVHTLTYLDQCISEAMRLFPPGLMLDRVCTEDVTVHGVKFTKGLIALIPVYGIHMDPDTWDAPSEFRPQRFDPEVRDAMHQFAYMPFGHGPRNCIGMRLGQVELKMALAAVLKRFNVVTCPKTVYPVKLMKTKLQAVDDLWVKLERRVGKH